MEGGEREGDEQMEWAATILVRNGMISMWLQYVAADGVYIYKYINI